MLTENLDKIIEGILFVSGNPVAAADIIEKCGCGKGDFDKAVKALGEKYCDPSGLILLKFGGKLQLATNPKYIETISAVLAPIKEKELSKACLETLAIVAYKQPVTRLEIEDVRGVSSDYTCQILEKNNLIEVVGRKDAVGKPLLFGTTEEFLKRFRLENIDMLPDYETLMDRLQMIETGPAEAAAADTLYNHFDVPMEEPLPEFLNGEDIRQYGESVAITTVEESCMRINQYLAQCGVASRRNAESLVSDGRVKLNGKVVVALATDVGERDQVAVDDKPIKRIRKHAYLMLNKPKGCVSTVSDDKGRKTVMDYVGERKERLFPVGRLDYDSEGLLLLTTDGDFANLLTHPSHEVPKVYIARVEHEATAELVRSFQRGIVIDGKRTAPAKAKILEASKEESRIEVTITEGRNRQVRKMFEALGFEVQFLKRTQVGPLKLGGLGRGMSRDLTEREIAYFLPGKDARDE